MNATAALRQRSFLIVGLALASGALSTPVAGQVDGAIEGRTLTLEDALDLARLNNPIFRQVENDATGASWAVRNAYAGLLPGASVNSAATYQAEGPQRFGLFTSADIGAGTSTDYLYSSYNINLTYSLSASTFARIKSAKADRSATGARIAAAEFTMESAVTAQYLATLGARDRVRASQRALERAEENFELVSAWVEVGAVVATDGKQAEVDQGRALVQLLQDENALRSEMLRLMEQLGLPLEEELVLASEFEIFDPDFDGQELTQRALASHPALRAYAESERARSAGVWQARSSYFPTISVFANWSGFARQVGSEKFLLNQARDGSSGGTANCEFLNQVSNGLSSPLDGYPRDCSTFALTPGAEAEILASNQVFPFNWDKDPLSLTFQVSLPIFQGFDRQVQVEQAQNLADDAREQRRAEELRLRTAVTQAVDDLRTNYRVIEIESRSREVATEQLDLARERYRLGAAAYLELLQAEESLATAERDYLNALYSFHSSVFALELAVGARLLTDAADE